MSKYGSENRNIPNLSIPAVFITSEDEEESPPLNTNEYAMPINLNMSQLSYLKDDDAASTAPLLESGTATPLGEDPYVPLTQLGTFLMSSQKLKSDLNSEEIGLSALDDEKKSEGSFRGAAILPEYSIVKWRWNFIRNAVSFCLFAAIFGAMTASAVMIAHLPRRCDPTTEWWQGKVFYEIFPSSFHDSNADGIGDLKGLTMKLDYLKNDLNVDAVKLNSIFEASSYPDHYLDIINATKVDPVLGDLRDFQDLIANVVKRNMSLILDIHVDRLPGLSGSFAEEDNVIVQRTLTFWLRQGVHGFFLKGLDRFKHEADIWKAVAQWKKLAGKHKKERILIVSSDFLSEYSKIHPAHSTSQLRDQFNLVEHYLRIDQINDIAHQIAEGLRWDDDLMSPWILWSLGNVEKTRLINLVNINAAGKSHCDSNLGALMLAMNLPGSVSLYQGDEMSASSSSMMEFNEKMIICSNSSIAAFGNLSTIRKDAVPLYLNVLTKFDAKGIVESRNFNYKLSRMDSTIIVERFYPRRHRYLLILNLSASNVTHDFSSVYFGGRTLISSSGEKNGYIELRILNLQPAEGLLLQLDR